MTTNQFASLCSMYYAHPAVALENELIIQALREGWHEDDQPNNRPQDGRVCDCEDAPCCGHYEL